eukprot:m.261309 g.261309  ORF g.261309 m.261309 type:complete len:290 (-) comp41853_c0_seq1:200-1069(-)
MEGLNEALSFLGPSGFVVSTQYKAALASSLVVLKHDYKFESVKFWGTITTTSKDVYHIAQGIGASELTDRKSFYSKECAKFAELPYVHEVIAASAKKIRTRFTGSASKEFVVTEPGPSASEEPVDLPAEVSALRQTETTEDGETITTTITEDKRLSALVQWIDEECATVPYGAFMKTAGDEIVPTPNYRGITAEDAAKLGSFLHFRIPTGAKPTLERAQADRSLDFFDKLVDDIPNGCWTLRNSAGIVLMKSLLWPGFTFYYKPGTNTYGQIYNGIGQKNGDIAFMLPK